MPIEDHRKSGSWRLRLPLIVGALAGAGAMTQVGVPTDAQAFARAVREQVTIEAVGQQDPAGVGDEFDGPVSTRLPEVATARVADEIDTLASVDRDGKVWRALETKRFASHAAHRSIDPAQSGRTQAAVAAPPGAVLQAPSNASSNTQAIGRQVIASHIARTWRVDEADVREYVSLAFSSAREHEVDPLLVLAIIATESSFNPRARSKAGAEGLMQVHTRVHKDKLKRHGGPKAVFDPAVNIDVGSKILKQYLDRYGRPQRALKAYVGAADLPHDHGYASKVLKRKAEFRNVLRNGELAARERESREREAAAVLTSGERAPRS